jgi:hypothetical protein
VDHEFRAHDSCRECVASPMDSWKSSDCAVGEGVWKGTHADHHEELETVVFEGEGEGGETFVVRDEALDEVFEDGA